MLGCLRRRASPHFPPPVFLVHASDSSSSDLDKSRTGWCSPQATVIFTSNCATEAWTDLTVFTCQHPLHLGNIQLPWIAAPARGPTTTLLCSFSAVTILQPGLRRHRLQRWCKKKKVHTNFANIVVSSCSRGCRLLPNMRRIIPPSHITCAAKHGSQHRHGWSYAMLVLNAWVPVEQNKDSPKSALSLHNSNWYREAVRTMVPPPRVVFAARRKPPCIPRYPLLSENWCWMRKRHPTSIRCSQKFSSRGVPRKPDKCRHLPCIPPKALQKNREDKKKKSTVHMSLSAAVVDGSSPRPRTRLLSLHHFSLRPLLLQLAALVDLTIA